MRTWIALLVLAGCMASPLDVASEMPLDVFVFDDPAADAFGATHGVMVRVHNPTARDVAYEVAAPNMTAGRLGPVAADGWRSVDVARGVASAPVPDVLGPQESRLWLLEYDGTRVLHVYDLVVLAEGASFSWQQTLPTAYGRIVKPGMHVVTYTAGVWVNGTSFYTNVQAFNDDPRFPAGYDRASFAGEGLPVYVYDQDRSEQPPRSIDTCHFTTVPGYNALLKTQTEGGTGVRFLLPEEGYTRPGNEDHFLYGEPLVFLNRVAAIEDRDDRLDAVPDPQGACFDPDRYTPDPVPDITA